MTAPGPLVVAGGIVRHIDRCASGVMRGGQYESWDKVAVALARTPEDGTWPVCAYHTRKDTAVPLAKIVAAARKGGA